MGSRVAWPWGRIAGPNWASGPPALPERSGALARGLDGTESPFRPPPVAFFDVTASQPLFPRTRTYGALMPKADGIESPFVNWINLGWDQTATQPLHRLYRSPDVGDSGIEAPFVPPITIPPSGFEQPQLAFRSVWRKPALVGIDGIEAPFVFFSPTAWPSPDVDPRKRFEIGGGLMRGEELRKHQPTEQLGE